MKRRRLSEEALINAVKRLVSGPTGSGTRLYGLSYGEAQDRLFDAITELVALREENIEWVCGECKMSYIRQGQCPTCEEVLVSKAVVRTQAYVSEIGRLQDQIVLLERIALQSLGLSTDTEA